MTNEEIARGNATQWCRCFKCDGFIRDSNIKCDKDKLVTCAEWYNGYRTALMACRDKDKQFKEYLSNAVKAYKCREEAYFFKEIAAIEIIINELFGGE